MEKFKRKERVGGKRVVAPLQGVKPIYASIITFVFTLGYVKLICRFWFSPSCVHCPHFQLGKKPQTFPSFILTTWTSAPQ